MAKTIKSDLERERESRQAEPPPLRKQFAEILRDYVDDPAYDDVHDPLVTDLVHAVMRHEQVRERVHQEHLAENTEEMRAELDRLQKANNLMANALQGTAYEAKDILQLRADLEEARKYAETTRYHQQQHAEAYRELVKVRAELDALKTKRLWRTAPISGVMHLVPNGDGRRESVCGLLASTTWRDAIDGNARCLECSRWQPDTEAATEQPPFQPGELVRQEQGNTFTVGRVEKSGTDWKVYDAHTLFAFYQWASNLELADAIPVDTEATTEKAPKCGEYGPNNGICGELVPDGFCSEHGEVGPRPAIPATPTEPHAGVELDPRTWTPRKDA